MLLDTTKLARMEQDIDRDSLPGSAIAGQYVLMLGYNSDFGTIVTCRYGAAFWGITSG